MKKIENNHIYKITNTHNSLNVNQQNDPIENQDTLKSRQNKLASKESYYTIFIKGIYNTTIDLSVTNTQ